MFQFRFVRLHNEPTHSEMPRVIVIEAPSVVRALFQFCERFNLRMDKYLESEDKEEYMAWFTNLTDGGTAQYIIR